VVEMGLAQLHRLMANCHTPWAVRSAPSHRESVGVQIVVIDTFFLSEGVAISRLVGYYGEPYFSSHAGGKAGESYLTPSVSVIIEMSKWALPWASTFFKVDRSA
jgi:hypothetical protein